MRFYYGHISQQSSHLSQSWWISPTSASTRISAMHSHCCLSLLLRLCLWCCPLIAIIWISISTILLFCSMRWSRRICSSIGLCGFEYLSALFRCLGSQVLVGRKNQYFIYLLYPRNFIVNSILSMPVIFLSMGIYSTNKNLSLWRSYILTSFNKLIYQML